MSISLQQAVYFNADASLNLWMRNSLAAYSLPSWIATLPTIVEDAPQISASVPCFALMHIPVTVNKRYEGGIVGDGYVGGRATSIFEVDCYVSRKTTNWSAILRTMVDMVVTSAAATKAVIIQDYASAPTNPQPTAFKINIGDISPMPSQPDANPDIERVRVLIDISFTYRTAEQFQLSTGAVVTNGPYQPLSPVLTGIAAGDFTLAQHNHQNAAGGGTLDAAAIASGTLNNARVNFAAPAAIGGTTPASGAFTTLSGSGALTLSGAPGIIKPGADSTNALQITKADGSTVLMKFDSTNTQIGVGGNPLAGAALYVTGTLGFTGQLFVGNATEIQVRDTAGSGNTRGIAGLKYVQIGGDKGSGNASTETLTNNVAGTPSNTTTPTVWLKIYDGTTTRFIPLYT